MKMKNIKTFEEYDELVDDTVEIDMFNSLSHEDKINYLVKNFAMDEVEAHEICPDVNITVNDLPDEIREYFKIF